MSAYTAHIEHLVAFISRKTSSFAAFKHSELMLSNREQYRNSTFLIYFVHITHTLTQEPINFCNDEPAARWKGSIKIGQRESN